MLQTVLSTSAVHADGGDDRDHRALPAGGRLHRAGGAQGPGRFPGASGPHARGPARSAAAHRRRAQAAAQGRHHSGRFRQGHFLVRAVRLHHHRPDGIFRAAVRQNDLCGGCECGAAGDFRGLGDGHPRDHSGRLVVQQPLFAAGRAAQRGATGELRSGAVVCAAFRRDGGGDAEHAADHPDAAVARHLVRSSTTTAS